MSRHPASLPRASTTTAELTHVSIEKQQRGTHLDLSIALAEKRKQLDEEIAKFKDLKEKEFLDFERELVKQRPKQKPNPGPTPPAKNPGDNGKTLSLLSAVVNTSRHHENGFNLGEKEHVEHAAIPHVRGKPSLVASKPTLHVDKLHINGESNVTPKAVAARVADDSSRSPSPTLALRRQFAHSTSKAPEKLTRLTLPPHPKSRQERKPQVKEELQDKALNSVGGHDNRSSKSKHVDSASNLAAILTPTYLPLLESYKSSMKVPLASSASASISPVSHHRRSKTEPIHPCSSLPLPSALRTPSGSAIRKHKHVTLQLADSVIVEPSSSYEEGPSPIAEDDLHIPNTAHVLNGQEQEGGTGAEDDEYPENSTTEFLEKRTPKLRRTSVKEFRDKRKEKKQQQQQEQQQREPEQQRHSLRSPLEVSINDSHLESGVGFFELDEELTSPARDLKSFDDDDADDRAGSQEAHIYGQEYEREDRVGISSLGVDPTDMQARFSEKGYVYSGSVPIDIVRPSSSWIESFGH